MINPRVSDNDQGEITVSLDDKELRGWSYANDTERRTKMLQSLTQQCAVTLGARVTSTGWHSGIKVTCVAP